MLKVTSLNINGIRAALKKGVTEWIQAHDADVLCLQETRISEADLKDNIRKQEGYKSAFNPAEKKGYSGVALYYKGSPEITAGMGCEEFDPEGRIISGAWDDLTVVSAYLPSGSSS